MPVRKQGIKVTAESVSGPGYIVYPVSEEWRRAFATAVFLNGGPDDDSVFFQTFDQLVENIGEEMGERNIKELSDGWDVTFIVDPWVVGNWYGYDAYRVAELGPKEFMRIAEHKH